jgi:hypothetical protein
MSWERILKNDGLEDVLDRFDNYLMEMASLGINDIDELAKILESQGFKTAVEDDEISLASRNNKLMGTVIVYELSPFTTDLSTKATQEEKRNISEFLGKGFSAAIFR